MRKINKERKRELERLVMTLTDEDFEYMERAKKVPVNKLFNIVINDSCAIDNTEVIEKFANMYGVTTDIIKRRINDISDIWNLTCNEEKIKKKNKNI